ncbi:lmo0937 family membrane protein [Novosphingobium cyanobacteriorum]|uniref:Lmo0937 family membrane protein n=1 Tax=Novosphingobium cyanobacteriorum TaxID=3024215 RepID=A0ABT6CHE3_9SPHN|nr:lmo0937 family membrane protein [Novosphingobium cyanobacteriorum]MDF8333350.1 lmo0937 family membrane protein [Novosphingobium cyanobacteriorum]
MLMTIALILLVLWALGVFAFKVTAGVIHLLLIVAIVVGLIQLFRGRRTV